MAAQRTRTGRPTRFSRAVADDICAKLAEGHSLRRICKAAGMPGQSTVYQWLQAHKSFAEQYALARELQADTLADEILDLADRSRTGLKIKTLPDGRKETTSGDMVERTRLQIDARKWLAGKLRPKVYGEVRGRGDGLSADESAALLRELAAGLPD